MYTSLESDTLEYLSGLSRKSRRRFWSGASCLRRSSLFSLYAKIFRMLLGRWEKGSLDESAQVDEYACELERLVLPSNEEWRLRVYYRLVELQRESDCAQAIEDKPMTEDPAVRDGSYSKKPLKEFSRSRDKDKWDWEPNAGTAYPLTPRSRHRLDSLDSNASVILDGCVEPGWKLEDILLAAKLLLTDDPHQQNHYRDEAEMRRVYGLVYDVLRYETVLERALDDVGFWGRYGRLKKRDKVVRLLLYDMQGRKFARVGNGAAIARRNEALAEAGLLDIEKALLATRTRLAASLSRLRIGGSALSLDELLPAHLRTAEGVTWGEEGSIASGWVNSAKLPSRSDFVNEMSKLGLRLCSVCSPTGELDEDQYAFDPLCPKVVNLHEKARERLAVSDLVRSHSFVFLERSLCVGAAAMVQAIRAGKLCGPVIVTHGTTLAPRHTGYLAELLADVENAGVILVFALGDELDRHRAYLDGLGISLQRYKLYAERYPCAPSSAEIERATIVLATPPCSYTGVRDVVDLAIARGGDLRLLESLTSTDSESPRQPRVLLAEQMATLRYALTRPNVQLLFYEVHTLLPCETTDMIKQAFDYANKMARDKYLREHPRKKPHPKEPGKKSKRKRSLSVEQIAQKSQQQDESRLNLESEEEALDIPESDLFEMSTLNDLYKQDCGRLLDPGSFIVVVKRKEMMQFNSLFMIKVAEAKGVFGQLTLKRPKTPEPTDDSCDNALAPPTPVPSDPKIDRKKSRKKSKIHFERLAAPTYASVARVLHERQVCPRHHQHLVHEESTLESQKSPAPPEPIPDPPALITHCNSQSPPTDSSSEDDDDDSDSCANEESAKAKERLESKYANGDSGGGSVVQRSSAKKLYSSALPSPMPDLFDDYVKRKGHGDLFNIRFKPMHLQARRHGPQLRARRLNRIPFQSRLDTVYEHSQSFSYTPLTRTSDGVLVDKGLLK